MSTALIDFDSAIEDARENGTLQLPFLGLLEVPQQVWDLGLSLRRLDLGYNSLKSIPPSIASLRNLEELWLNNNPQLTSLPTEIESCVSLRYIDLRYTGITELSQGVARLPNLIDVCLQGTKVDPILVTAQARNGIVGLLNVLSKRGARLELEANLRERLTIDVYRGTAESELGQRAVEALVQETLRMLPEDEDVRLVTRNAERLFHTSLFEANVPDMLDKLYEIQIENAWKAMRADVTLLLRATYYHDVGARRVSLEHLEECANMIMQEVRDLDDVHFLLKNAKKILPADAHAITGDKVQAAITSLRSQLLLERREAIAMLELALQNLYPHRDMSDIKLVAERCASALTKSDDIRSLAADVAQLFPPEFAMIKKNKIIAAFRHAQREKGLS